MRRLLLCCNHPNEVRSDLRAQLQLFGEENVHKVLGLREAVRCRRKKAEERRNRRIREEREDILAVKEVFEENYRIYGCRRMRQALENRGKIMSEWRVRRIMRENGLYPEQLGR